MIKITFPMKKKPLLLCEKRDIRGLGHRWCVTRQINHAVSQHKGKSCVERATVASLSSSAIIRSPSVVETAHRSGG